MKGNFFSFLKRPFINKGTLSLPGDVLALYVQNYFSKKEKDILNKLEVGETLEDSEYKYLIENHFMKPDESYFAKSDGTEDFMEMFGITIVKGTFAIIPEKLSQIRIDVYDKILIEGLKPLYKPILDSMFPHYEISLGSWRTHHENDIQSLDSTLRTAWQFTVFEYLHGECVADYSSFKEFFIHEFSKRANLVKIIWKNRVNGSDIKYIPIYESFRNYERQDAVYILGVIKRFFSSDDILINEKSELENCLISQATKMVKFHDQGANDIQNDIVEPVVSVLVNYRKAEENLISAKELYKLGHFDVSISRCYYSMMRALRSLLAEYKELNQWQYEKLSPNEDHKALVNKFRSEIIGKRKLMSKAYLVDFKDVKQYRWVADYNDIYLDVNICESCIGKAEKFLAEVKKLIKFN